MVSDPFANLPEITSESEEGLVDLVFRVQEYKRLADGSQSIKAAGLHRGRKVGFKVVLGPTWKMRQLHNNIPLTISRGSVSYHREGPESDAFVQILDELYLAQQSPKTMAAEAPFTGISLEGDPEELESGLVKIKLFYEKDGEDGYAELYTNIDLATLKLEVREKDEGYRRQVVRALQGQ